MRIPTPAGFSLDALLAELKETPEQAPGYQTVLEWAAHFGISKDKMRRLMWTARDQGKLLLSHRAGLGIDGRLLHVPVYRFDLEFAQEPAGESGAAKAG